MKGHSCYIKILLLNYNYFEKNNLCENQNRKNLIYRAGFIAWEYLEDTDLAKKYYTQFLNEYPNDDKAPEVQEILNSGMLEMTDEAILNMLKGK